jgi:hypothetical protein
MKVKEFKKILRPLIKQTVKEVLLEEGVLSNIVAEVARGLSSTVITEQAPARKKQVVHDQEKEQEYERNRQERIRRLNESTNMNVNVFENTSEIKESAGHSPLAGTPSSDSGVDISGILKVVDNKWRQLM